MKIFVQEVSVLNIYSKRKNNLKKLKYILFKGNPYNLIFVLPSEVKDYIIKN